MTIIDAVFFTWKSDKHFSTSSVVIEMLSLLRNPPLINFYFMHLCLLFWLKMEQNMMNVINTHLPVLRKVAEKLAKLFSIIYLQFLVNQGEPKWLEVGKCDGHLQEVQEGRSRKLQAFQSDLSARESKGADPLGCCVACTAWPWDQVQPTWLRERQVLLDRPGLLLRQLTCLLEEGMAVDVSTCIHQSFWHSLTLFSSESGCSWFGCCIAGWVKELLDGQAQSVWWTELNLTRIQSQVVFPRGQGWDSPV